MFLPSTGITSSDEKPEYIQEVQNSYILLRIRHHPLGAQSRTPVMSTFKLQATQVKQISSSQKKKSDGKNFQGHKTH